MDRRCRQGRLRPAGIVIGRFGRGSMRRLLLLVVAGVLASQPVFADHVGIYSESTGSSCILSAGLTSTAAVIHKFDTSGATGVRFRVDFSGAAGSQLFAFNTAITPVGTLTDDIAVAYGQCLSGTIVVGTMVAVLNNGRLYVRPANGKSAIIYTDCDFAEKVATGGSASIGNNDCNPNGVDTATWGEIKSLYR